MSLTKNISRYEMACQCGCGFDASDYELLMVAQDSADFFMHRDKASRVRMLIKSGNRCVEHNEEIQKKYNKDYVPFSSDSQHIHGKAIDYVLETWNGMHWVRISTDELATYLDKKYPGTYGIGKYWSGRIHLDVRVAKARWQG
jgi:uncharacterized protein YcbK (DUF882 family)